MEPSDYYSSLALRRAERVAVPNLQANDLETRIAILQKKAKQKKVVLPADVAHYIAQNVRLNASAWEAALIRLKAFSTLTGREISLFYTRLVLKNFIDSEAHKVTLEPAARIDASFSACLKIMDARKAGRGRQQLEVNMRESERERLARRDAYERELERRTRKRKLC